MKKITSLLTLLLLFLLVGSCSKENVDDNEALLKKASAKVAGLPVSDEGFAPYIIPGANRGGNRTCTEVGVAFMGDPYYFDFCGEKLDFVEGDFLGDFPAGLDVMVTDGKYVSFNLGDCLKIGGNYYKVGAVIVKGGSDANVYFYPNGTYGDSGLAAPSNKGGMPAGLSNLTFCFVNCNPWPDLVVALKSYMTKNWACTSGGPGEIDFVAYYNFVPYYMGNKIYYYMDQNQPVGKIIVADVDGDGLMEVTIDNSEMSNLLFTDAYLFVGTLEDYSNAYWSFPYHEIPETPSATITFNLPF